MIVFSAIFSLCPRSIRMLSLYVAVVDIDIVIILFVISTRTVAAPLSFQSQLIFFSLRSVDIERKIVSTRVKRGEN